MPKISACVVAYNRAAILKSCLHSLQFADDLVVVDKSSTDETPEIGRRLADTYLRVPWSPTVEETREVALEQCKHDLIVYLDDDECLSAEAALFVRAEAANPRAEAYAIPFRHYVLGRHDERAYYWPQYRHAFFKRGAVRFSSTVHGGVHVETKSCYEIDSNSPICIHHLSCEDVATWLEKTNRYTSQPNRRSSFASEGIRSIAEFAQQRLAHWLQRVEQPDPYLETVSVLRGLYDIVDGLKHWESTRPPGREAFADLCRRLESEYAAASPVLPRRRDRGPL